MIMKFNLKIKNECYSADFEKFKNIVVSGSSGSKQLKQLGELVNIISEIQNKKIGKENKC